MISLVLALAATPPAEPIAPKGPWVVRAEENMCLLERNYPVGDAMMSLVFMPLLDLDEMEVFVAMPAKDKFQYQGNFVATVPPATQKLTGRYFSVFAPASRTRLTRLTTERRLLDELKDGDALRIQAKPVDHTFRIAKPDKARVALKTCIDGLKRSWGIDPSVAAREVSPVEGNPGRYFDSGAYPREAYSQGIYGRVIALLNIDTSGNVATCRIVSSAGTALNEATCKTAMRIRFKPARDKDSVALPSTYVLPVRWILPGSP